MKTTILFCSVASWALGCFMGPYLFGGGSEVDAVYRPQFHYAIYSSENMLPKNLVRDGLWLVAHDDLSGLIHAEYIAPPEPSGMQ